MNIAHEDILKQSLSQLTYNGEHIQIPQREKLNLYMGIGLWSVTNRLSIGLPIDVLQMLLSAAVLRSKMLEANPQGISKVIILIADSMAVDEGAEKKEVSRIVSIYRRCLEPLLDALKLTENSQVILSSDLARLAEYQEILLSLEQTPVLQTLKEDQEHYRYIHTQTAITRYMHLHQNVGVKVGWICNDSSQQLDHSIEHELLKNWDELKFDRIGKAVCSDSRIQYLYAKAGLKQPKTSTGQVNIMEGCPYTAYDMHNRYLFKVERDRNTILKPLRKVVNHWRPIVKVCVLLKANGIVKDTLLPGSCIHKTNDVATVQLSLNYWTNLPTINNETI
ncbi:MAG: hypothetical protein CK425_10055 [Parachlamydia sp.]|nr:MAG: hypothetical protein CK425_10055 [Parachlamydia sp.]